MLRELAPYFLFVVFAMQPLGLHAQTTKKPKPGFKLTLAKSSFGAMLPATTQVLEATYINNTWEKDHTYTCASEGAFYLEIVFNGVDVTKDYPQHTGIRGALPCIGIPSASILKPGASKHGYLNYDVSKPGTYEFTVEQDTFPDDPSKNVTVRSNTVTVVVPAAASTGNGAAQ
jgi:hypothetical protein